MISAFSRIPEKIRGFRSIFRMPENRFRIIPKKVQKIPEFSELFYKIP